MNKGSLMAGKPSYEALEKRIQELEKTLETYRLSQEPMPNLADMVDMNRSEERYRSLIDFSPLPFLVTQEEKIVFVNPAVMRLFNVKDKSKIIGSSPDDWIHPDLKKKALQRRRLVMEKGTPVDPVELGLIQQDGTTISVLANTVQINHQGAPALLSVFQDITEQKKAEKNLDDIIEHLPVGIGILDSQGNILRLNQRFKEMFGYTENDISSVENWAASAYPDKDYREKTLAVWNQYLSKAFETGLNTPPMDVEITCKDKTTKNVLISLQPGNNQHLTTFVDITEQKKAEAERTRLMSAVEQAAEMFVITDTDGIIQYVNPAFEQITGYTVKEAIGSNPRILKSGRQDPAFYRRLWHTILSGSSWQGRMTNKKKDGSFYIEEMVISPVFDPEGEIANFVAVKRDLTSTIKMQETLHQVQKMESIGSLAGGIAHDFNNILFPIVGLSEMMLDDFPPESMERQNIQEILNAGTRGRELVQQILSFSRQSEHQPIPVHIQKILKEVLKLCRATIPADITITKDIQTDCGSVMADPTQIHQIAMNLITNAYHAVETAGGTISLQLTEMGVNQTDDPVEDLTPGRYAMLSVSDTGTGIDPAVISKIFDPYFTTKEKGRGTGLGLATVYGIVKSYGGEIRVFSDFGKGTTFHVYLPLLEKAQEPETKKETFPLPTGTEHILLVDDEKPIVHLEKQMLERLGYQTTCFTSSRDALAAFQADPSHFDLVITDMNMPHITGMQLAKELIAARSDICIIICTGFSERINKEKAADIGIRGFLMKPVIRSKLAAMVRQVLDGTK